jgi:hypothetical protein
MPLYLGYDFFQELGWRERGGSSGITNGFFNTFLMRIK